MNRQQFAETVANAYVNQFATNGSPVMNQRIIVYDRDKETFSSQSSLTPVYDSEVIVMWLEDGMFGSELDTDAPDTAESLALYLRNDDLETWQNVIEMIAEAA